MDLTVSDYICALNYFEVKSNSKNDKEVSRKVLVSSVCTPKSTLFDESLKHVKKSSKMKDFRQKDLEGLQETGQDNCVNIKRNRKEVTARIISSSVRVTRYN